jgi:hypothetical protein
MPIDTDRRGEPDMAEVSALLAERIESLATELVGEEPTNRRRGEWRFRGGMSLVVTVAGPRRGVWSDFNPPAGGRPPGPEACPAGTR